MRLCCLVIALALTATASDSWGESKQPSPKASQQNSAQQERGTEQYPFVIKVTPSEKPKDEFETEKAKQESDRQLVKLTGDLANYTKLLFIATGLLFIATAGLVAVSFWQTRDAKRSIKAAEKSAAVAEKSLNELEAPVLAIKFNDTGIHWGPARNITFSHVKFGSGSLFADVTQKAYFRGFIRYRDIFGNQYVMGFCFVFDINESRWVLMGGKNHNYRKRDDATEFPEWMHPSADKGSIRSAINRAFLDPKGESSS